METRCAYCGALIRRDPGPGLVSHGMCLPCAEHFERLWAGMPLGEYLDAFDRPVMLVDAEGRLIAGNSRLAAALDRDRSELAGLLGGQAFACVRSRLPGGCGKTVHCRECAVRQLVEGVRETGRGRSSVPAYLDTGAGRVDLRLTARPDARGGVLVVVEEMRSEAGDGASG